MSFLHFWLNAICVIISHELHGMFYLCDVKCDYWMTGIEEICAINASSGLSNKTDVIVIMSMWTLVLHQTAEPQVGLWHKCCTYCITESFVTPPHPRINQNCQLLKLTCRYFDTLYLIKYMKVFAWTLHEHGWKLIKISAFVVYF